MFFFFFFCKNLLTKSCKSIFYVSAVNYYYAYIFKGSNYIFCSSNYIVIAHRNHFFHLYQKDKSSASKVKSSQASNRCKRVLEAAKLAYANKTKESITSRLGSCDFWRIANSVLNKGKSAIPPLFNGVEVLSSPSIKQNCLLKTFLRALLLMTQVSL